MRGTYFKPRSNYFTLIVQEGESTGRVVAEVHTNHYKYNGVSMKEEGAIL